MQQLWLWDRVGLLVTDPEGRSQPILTSEPPAFAMMGPNPMRELSAPIFVRASDGVELKLEIDDESRSCKLLVPQSSQLRSMVPFYDPRRSERFPSVLVLETNGDLSMLNAKEERRRFGCVPDALGVFVGDGRRGSIVALRCSNFLLISSEVDILHEFDAEFWETRIDGVFDLVAVKHRMEENLQIACVSGLSVVWFQKEAGEDDFVKIKEHNLSRPAEELRFSPLDNSLLVVLDDGRVERIVMNEEAGPPIALAKPSWWTVPAVFAQQDDLVQHVLIPCLSSFQLSQVHDWDLKETLSNWDSLRFELGTWVPTIYLSKSRHNHMQERGGLFWLPRTSRLWPKQLRLEIWTFLLVVKRYGIEGHLLFPPKVRARIILHAAQNYGCVTFPPLFENNLILVMRDLSIYKGRLFCFECLSLHVSRWLAQLLRKKLTLDKKESDMQNLVIDGLRTRLGHRGMRSPSNCEICNEPLSVSLRVEPARWHSKCEDVARCELVNMIKEAVMLSLPLKVIERLIRCFGALEENQVENMIEEALMRFLPLTVIERLIQGFGSPEEKQVEKMIVEEVMRSLPLAVMERLIHFFCSLDENEAESIFKLFQLPGTVQKHREELLKYFSPPSAQAINKFISNQQ